MKTFCENEGYRSYNFMIALAVDTVYEYFFAAVIAFVLEKYLLRIGCFKMLLIHILINDYYSIMRLSNLNNLKKSINYANNKQFSINFVKQNHIYFFIFLQFFQQSYRQQIMLEESVLTSQIDIERKLKLLCENYPVRCLKENNTGISSNKRIIHVSNNAFQYYNQFKGFKQGQSSTLNPTYLKATVNIQDIHSLTLLPLKSEKKNSISLKIPQQSLKIKQQFSFSGSKRIVTWNFYFDFDVKTLIQYRRQEEQKRNQEEYKILRQFYQSEEEQKRKALSMRQIQQQRQIKQQQSKSFDIYVSNMKKMKTYLSMKEKFQDQAKNVKQRKNKIEHDLSFSQQMASEKQHETYALSFFWKEYFYSFDQAVKSRKTQNRKTIFKQQANLLQEICHFHDNVSEIVMNFIDEKLIGWKQQAINFMDFTFYKGVWIKLGDKNLNYEYLTNYYLSDIFYAMNQINGIKLRIPLMSFCKYKGFKMLIMMNMPFFNDITKTTTNNFIYTSKFGFHGNYTEAGVTFKIRKALNTAQNVMNVKKSVYPFVQDFIKDQSSIPLSAQMSIYEFSNKRELELQRNIDPFYYILNLPNVYPWDYNYIQNNKDKDSWLRPQTIFEFRDIYLTTQKGQDTKLWSKAFKNVEEDFTIKKKQNIKVAKLSNHVLKKKIPALIEKLNNIDVMYIDSFSISQSFHEEGINIRYLYRFSQLTNLPYLKQILLIQALARTIKKLYKQSMAQFLNSQQQFQRKKISNRQKTQIGNLIKQHTLRMAENVIDFLNLIFGIGQQSQCFWEIIGKRSQEKFKLTCQYPPPVKPGALLHAVLYHCQFVINFKINIPLFKTHKPFRIQNWQYFKVKTQIFDFPSSQYNKIVRNISHLTQIQQKQLIDQISMNFLRVEIFQRSSTFMEIQSTLSKMNIFKENLIKPQLQVPYHPIQVTHYITNKSQGNFQKALEILNFALPDNHPLYISLYDSYSDFMQPQLLKRTSLLIAMKSLGQFHPKTTNLYEKYYRSGYKQFALKAMRGKTIRQVCVNCQKMFQEQKYQSCMNISMQLLKQNNQSSIKDLTDLQSYLTILDIGAITSNKTYCFENAKTILFQASLMVQFFKVNSHERHQAIFRQALICLMSISNNKYFIYKMVLLALHIQKDQQGRLPTDENGLRLPVVGIEKIQIMKGFIQNYFPYDNHYKWIEHIFKELLSSIMYFNYLDDLFINYKLHFQRYGQIRIKQALGYLHLFVKLFGQDLFYQHLYEIKPREQQ